MKYMLLIYSAESSWSQEEWTACTVESTALCHELNAKGQFRGASPLHPVAETKNVRVRGGQRLITDGPFAETTEQLGGYFLVDVPDLDEAISVAGRIPAAKKGTVEIRPLYELRDLPADATHSTSHGKRFMLACYDDEQAWAALGTEALEAAMQEAVQLAHQLAAQGHYLTASPLHPVSTATSVRVRDGKRSVTDGPFAETREVLGGYYLITVNNLDEAVRIAAQHSGARVGSVDVREVYELPNLP